MDVTTQPPQLAIYTDFRSFLRDFYEFKRAQTASSLRPYSYAHFSAAADIRSPNYLKLIIEGQRNLSEDMMGKFAKAMQLSKDEVEEFRVLVRYGQAKDPLERNRYLKDLSEFRVKAQLKSGEIKTETWDKVPGWVTWVLYALVDQQGVVFEPEALWALLRGKASIDEIRKSLNRLLTSGEIVRDEHTGQYRKGRELMTGSDTIPVALVRKLQAELIYLGLESLFQDAAVEREFGALTMALTADEFEQLKFELRQLRKRFFKDYAVKRHESKGERVFQLNIQLFPVTQKTEAVETALEEPVIEAPKELTL